MEEAQPTGRWPAILYASDTRGKTQVIHDDMKKEPRAGDTVTFGPQTVRGRSLGSRFYEIYEVIERRDTTLDGHPGEALAHPQTGKVYHVHLRPIRRVGL